MPNQSPLRYPGGKTRACKILDGIVCKYFDPFQFTTLVSPFFGGGSFEFYLSNKYGYSVIANDKFVPLYSFWAQCQTNKHALCERLIQTGFVSKHDFSRYRSQIIEETDPATQAYLYFVINRCSFSGSTLSGGFSQQAANTRFTKSSIERIRNLELSSFSFSNQDFTSFIPSSADTDSLMFVDPPYYLGHNSKLYGCNGDLHEQFDHFALYNILIDKQNWLMTYNDCEFIRNLYADYTIVDCNWSYGMNKTKASSEIVIISQ